ncbi:AraC family transcriptional regulator [Acinetobacter baylyi]|uniref:AraC family transcriptional regulator n=1 Tax=Acinetobacter baylyi TaxID=202950 RepID=UPI000EA327BB|nr:AraC family transcriptional regulator [Acinetobacter baylyi]
MDLLSHSNKGTISIALVNEALQGAYTTGLDVEKIVKAVGISPELLAFPKARVTIDQYARLWIELADVLNDEFFAMDSHPMRRGSYQLLAKLAMQSETLEKALQDILHYFSNILDDIHPQLKIDNHQAYIVLQDRQHPKRMFVYATLIMLIHGLLCWLSDQRISIDHIKIKSVKPTYPQDYYIRFCEKIEFSSDENLIAINSACLKLKIKKNKNDLTNFLKHTPHNLLVRYKNEDALGLLIRRHLIRHHPSEWPELKQLSHELHMSEATLQRRLKAENMSYQALKNEIRCDIAIEQLINTKHTLNEISEALDFHDPSAFHRAFKKWMGMSPSAYRKAYFQHEIPPLSA